MGSWYIHHVESSQNEAHKAAQRNVTHIDYDVKCILNGLLNFEMEKERAERNQRLYFVTVCI